MREALRQTPRERDDALIADVRIVEDRLQSKQAPGQPSGKGGQALVGDRRTVEAHFQASEPRRKHRRQCGEGLVANVSAGEVHLQGVHQMGQVLQQGADVAVIRVGALATQLQASRIAKDGCRDTQSRAGFGDVEARILEVELGVAAGQLEGGAEVGAAKVAGEILEMRVSGDLVLDGQVRRRPSLDLLGEEPGPLGVAAGKGTARASDHYSQGKDADRREDGEADGLEGVA
mmetsp:Transcript_30690/g.89036  ORF Transcript_30690/g.89036 Transcript_30690/m.89036 type:complete len:232 (-) Transcript_30690:399-1094(-)